MTNNELTESLRNCEKNVLAGGFLVLLILLSVWLYTEKFYFSGILGYYLGSLSFVVLIEGFLALEKAPTWLRIPTVVLSNLKLFFLALVIYGLYRLGCSVTEIVLGIIASQLVVVIMVVWLYFKRKAASKA